MNLYKFDIKFHDEIRDISDTSKKSIKVLQYDGEVLEIGNVEYEPETNTLWIKVDG